MSGISITDSGSLYKRKSDPFYILRKGLIIIFIFSSVCLHSSFTLVYRRHQIFFIYFSEEILLPVLSFTIFWYIYHLLRNQKRIRSCIYFTEGFFSLSSSMFGISITYSGIQKDIRSLLYISKGI